MIGLVAGFIITAFAYRWVFDLVYDAGVQESVQRMHAAAHARLGETDEAVNILDQAMANQIHGLIHREDAVPWPARREYRPSGTLGLRLLRTYMELHPERYEDVLEYPRFERWPALDLDVIEDLCRDSTACTNRTAELLLRLAAKRENDEPRG